MSSFKLKRRIKKIFLFLPVVLLVALGIFLFYEKNFNDKENECENEVIINEEKEEEVNKEIIEDDKISKEITRDELTPELFSTTAKKVMIVAHPDDESLWGGNGLYHEKYLVVCLTCGVVDYRVQEFKNVMNVLGDDYLMLSYPDLVKGVKSDWKDQWNDINKDINKILSLKDWENVVTHNPEGEYGHIHHKYTSSIVTSHAKKDRLLYFGKYYLGEIPNADELYYLSDEEFKFKTESVLPLYSSQNAAVHSLYNMIHYEDWISYNEWYGE